MGARWALGNVQCGEVSRVGQPTNQCSPSVPGGRFPDAFPRAPHDSRPSGAITHTLPSSSGSHHAALLPCLSPHSCSGTHSQKTTPVPSAALRKANPQNQLAPATYFTSLKCVFPRRQMLLISVFSPTERLREILCKASGPLLSPWCPLN